MSSLGSTAEAAYPARVLLARWRGAWRLGASALLLALTGLFGSCATEPPNRDCQRLVEYSCGCFPECLPEDRAVIERQQADECDQRLREHYQNWQACATDCSGACEYGWGACALEIYARVGLPAPDVCAADAGADAAVDASGDSKAAHDGSDT